MTGFREGLRVGILVGFSGAGLFGFCLWVHVEQVRRDRQARAAQRTARRGGTVRVLPVPRPYDWANRGDW